MSKNFEEAYKAEVQQNIPDLWNRIESALPEKRIVPEESATTAFHGVKAEQTNLNHKSNQKKKKNPYAWIKWASLAAAAMLVVLLLPVVAGLGILGILGSKSSSDMAAAESEAMQETVAEDMYMDMEAPAVNEALTEDNIENMLQTDAMPESMPAENIKENPMQEEALEDGDLSAECEQNLLAEGMRVEVLEIEYASDNSLSCRVWLAIPEDAYATFETMDAFQSGRLEVLCYFEEEVNLEKGNFYEAAVYEVGGSVDLIAELQPEK